ncbi:hypothetical protein NEOC65_000757 [Neochlamydia sp. AcF65]|uniref:hypothetical protein n=1 Tax=Neochlamydia sp. AcF84 TaxID=2315858 RepID=UPI00140B5590|nr:hypothetical protein [Neochlamydia sp. AcF84]MBS4165692.1 hypothetical protein [Neochlamydia sp. AcF65]NGY95330.1 hypothetical protein [Neochlamydia sp. AcF84]
MNKKETRHTRKYQKTASYTLLEAQKTRKNINETLLKFLFALAGNDMPLDPSIGRRSNILSTL